MTTANPGTAELKKRIEELEAELKEAREAKASEEEDGDKEKKNIRITETMRSAADEFNSFAKGMIYAGLESVALTADVTRTFVDKAIERNRGNKRDSAIKQMAYLPWDMTEAAFDALDESIEIPRKMVDKFNEEYKRK